MTFYEKLMKSDIYDIALALATAFISGAISGEDIDHKAVLQTPEGKSILDGYLKLLNCEVADDEKES